LNIAPCKGCDERHIGCHSDCEKYREFRVQQDDVIKAKAKYLEGLYTSQNAKKQQRKKLLEGKR